MGNKRKSRRTHIRSLSHENLIKLSTKLLNDLKEARDQLNQGPGNSSRPPSSQALWEKGGKEAKEDERSSAESLSDEQDSCTGENVAQDDVEPSPSQASAAKRWGG